MAEHPPSIQGLAYVPGRVCGLLRYGPVPADPADILVIRQDQIAEVTSAAAGIIVLDGAPLSHHTIRLLGLGVPTVFLDAV